MPVDGSCDRKPAAVESRIERAIWAVYICSLRFRLIVKVWHEVTQSKPFKLMLRDSTLRLGTDKGFIDYERPVANRSKFSYRRCLGWVRTVINVCTPGLKRRCLDFASGSARPA